MRIINTATDNLDKLGPMHTHWVYNGLDCCLTIECLDVLLPQLTPELSIVYDFAIGMQAPALEMSLRGILVDQSAKEEVIVDLDQKERRLSQILEIFADAAWGKELNPNSPKQLQDFFYSWMKIPPIYINQKGVRKISTNREALEKLNAFFYAKPFVTLILLIRDYRKKLSTLRKGIDADGRMRSGYKTTGTETGRWSSTKNAFGTGDNIQNQTEILRRIYIADPGKKMGYADLEQAESRGVAAISGDEAYWNACHSGDLHTTVCKMVWTKLPWTGDSKRDKKEIAEQKFYRQFSYRDMAKRGGHGSNYRGTPRTMARHLKVAQSIMEDFQLRYFTQFSGLPKWHNEVAYKVQTTGCLITAYGRRRRFFGRPDDDATIRAAIAHEPQSTIVDTLNIGLWRIWKHLYKEGVLILAQVHDAILFLYPEDREDLLPKVLELMTVKIPIRNRVLVIPSEVSVGWNWGKYVDPSDAAKKKIPENLAGLRGWNGRPDERKRPDSKKFNILDTVLL